MQHEHVSAGWMIANHYPGYALGFIPSSRKIIIIIKVREIVGSHESDIWTYGVNYILERMTGLPILLYSATTRTITIFAGAVYNKYI